jgi:hypothetical protein
VSRGEVKGDRVREIIFDSRDLHATDEQTARRYGEVGLLEVAYLPVCLGQACREGLRNEAGPGICLGSLENSVS